MKSLYLWSSASLIEEPHDHCVGIGYSHVILTSVMLKFVGLTCHPSYKNRSMLLFVCSENSQKKGKNPGYTPSRDHTCTSFFLSSENLCKNKTPGYTPSRSHLHPFMLSKQTPSRSHPHNFLLSKPTPTRSHPHCF
jgi:hypothetical protein